MFRVSPTPIIRSIQTVVTTTGISREFEDVILKSAGPSIRHRTRDRSADFSCKVVLKQTNKKFVLCFKEEETVDRPSALLAIKGSCLC